MTTADAFAEIKSALDHAPRNGYVAELHVQVIKYARLFRDVSAKEFCVAVGIGQSFGTEFSKMRKIADRLIAAGLDVHRI